MDGFSQRLVGREGEENVDVVGEAIYIGKANVLALSLFAQVLIKGGSCEPRMPLVGGPDCVNPDGSVGHGRRWEGLEPRNI